MFAKLIVLILVCGSLGVGLLSVRQSRLQTVHEMAEARHRIRILAEQTGEIRTLIAQSSTPDRVHALIDDLSLYEPAIQRPARVELAAAEYESLPVPEAKQSNSEHPAAFVDPAEPRRDPGTRKQIWVLDDGSRVIFVEE